jgi:hypothetical protein
MTDQLSVQSIPWDFTINIGVLKRIKKELGIDPDTILDHVGDPIQLASLIWVIIAPQAAKHEITQDAFDAECYGDFVDKIANDFMDGFAAFFPKARQERVKKLREIGNLKIDHELKKMDRLLAEVEQEIIGQSSMKLSERQELETQTNTVGESSTG